MNCVKCKSQIADDAEFCPVCGRNQKGKQKKPFFVLFVITLLLLLAALSFIIFNRSGDKQYKKIEGPGAGSPVEAAANYLEAMKNCDIDGMLSCCAIESVVDNWNEEAYFDKYNGLGCYGEIFLQNTNFDTGINYERRRAEFFTQINQQLMRIAGITWNYIPASNLDIVNQDGLDQSIATDIDSYAATIGNIKELSASDLFDEDTCQEIDYSLEKQKEKDLPIYGIDDLTPVALSFECNGDTYIFFATACEYDGRWYILEFQGLYGKKYVPASLDDDATALGIVQQN